MEKKDDRPLSHGKAKVSYEIYFINYLSYEEWRGCSLTFVPIAFKRFPFPVPRMNEWVKPINIRKEIIVDMRKHVCVDLTRVSPLVSWEMKLLRWDIQPPTLQLKWSNMRRVSTGNPHAFVSFGIDTFSFFAHLVSSHLMLWSFLRESK